MLTFLCGYPYMWVNSNPQEKQLFQVTLITNLTNINFPNISWRMYLLYLFSDIGEIKNRFPGSR